MVTNITHAIKLAGKALKPIKSGRTLEPNLNTIFFPVTLSLLSPPIYIVVNKEYSGN